MTTREMTDAIGKPVWFVSGTLRFLCIVRDVKSGWGQPRFLIAPMAGTGERWVEFSSIEPVTETQMKVAAQNQQKSLTPGVSSCTIVSR